MLCIRWTVRGAASAVLEGSDALLAVPDAAGEVVRGYAKSGVEVQPVGVLSLRSHSRIEVELIAAEPRCLFPAPLHQRPPIPASAGRRQRREIVDVEAVAPRQRAHDAESRHGGAAAVLLEHAPQSVPLGALDLVDPADETGLR